MIRWAEISQDKHKERFEAICQVLDFYKIQHEGHHFTPEQGDAFNQVLKDAQGSCSLLHFRHPFIYLSSEVGLPATNLVSWVRARDSLQKIRDHWWPENHLFHSLPKIFTLNDLAIDLRGGGLVLGAGSRGRTSVAALVHMGIKKITIVDTDDKRAADSAKSLKKHFWGATIESQSHLALTYLPGSFSIVINALSPEKEARLISEISYFNFLYPSGVYMDLKSSSDAGLMEEAARVGARLVYGAQVTAIADAHWLKNGFQIDASLLEISDHLSHGHSATIPPQL